MEFRAILRDGIRCQLRWSVGNGKTHGSTSTLNDEEHARRHEKRKAAEWIRKGFVEVAPAPEEAASAAVADPEARVLDVVTAAVRHGAHPGFAPVAGFDETYHCRLTPGHPLSHHHYYVLSNEGRSAISFNVRADSHDAEAVAMFLEFVTEHRELPFDGASHHKVPLPQPIGRFSHVLFCSPKLGRSHASYPAIAHRVASAFPVADCEIGDGDTEVLVDARIRGRGSLPHTRWDREPMPVVDLRFEIQPSHFRRVLKFLVFRPSDLERLLPALAAADPGSWLEVRDFRGDVMRFTPASVSAHADLVARLST